ncbi:MAG: hypothetical protein ACLU7M_03395 [Mediterraneibacter gnavus]
MAFCKENGKKWMAVHFQRGRKSKQCCVDHEAMIGSGNFTGNLTGAEWPA